MRDFLLVHQLLVAANIVLRLDVIGNGLLQLCPRSLQLLTRHRNSGPSTFDFGLSRGQLAASIDRGNGNVYLHGLRRRQRILVGSLGASHGNLIVLGIDFDQGRSSRYILVIVNQ